jgi:hypothetical protein
MGMLGMSGVEVYGKFLLSVCFRNRLGNRKYNAQCSLFYNPQCTM